MYCVRFVNIKQRKKGMRHSVQNKETGCQSAILSEDVPKWLLNWAMALVPSEMA